MLNFLKWIIIIIILINQESSGKWPDELECIKRLKTAFYMKIVQLLRKSYGLTAFTHLNYCDIFYKAFIQLAFIFGPYS